MGKQSGAKEPATEMGDGRGRSIGPHCTQFADNLLGPITLILINEHTTHNLSEKCEKIWPVSGGCKCASSEIWKHLTPPAGLGVAMETTSEQRDDTDVWFKPPL